MRVELVGCGNIEGGEDVGAIGCATMAIRIGISGASLGVSCLLYHWYKEWDYI